MTLIDLKKRIVALLKSEFPEFSLYSEARVEQMNRPAFYSHLYPEMDIPANHNTRHVQYNLVLNYFQDVKDEGDVLDILQRLRDLFGLYIRVSCEDGDIKAVKVISWEYDYVGRERNIPEVTLTLEWFDNIAEPEDADIMEDLDVSTEYYVE